MASMYDAANVVVLHNVNAFGENRDAPAHYEEVFAFSDERAAAWNGDHLEVVFTFANGAAEREWHAELQEAYYAREIRSLSVSDVVWINGTFYLCEKVGWKNIGPVHPNEYPTA